MDQLVSGLEQFYIRMLPTINPHELFPTFSLMSTGEKFEFSCMLNLATAENHVAVSSRGYGICDILLVLSTLC